MKETVAIIHDPKAAARKAHLRYVNAGMPGISRKRYRGKFRYYNADGSEVKDAATLERIRQLVLPPAWENVWICPLSNGHLQATGTDTKGRKQYRYHAGWNAVRSQTKFARVSTFANALEAVRQRVNKDLQRRSIDKPKVLATVVYLMEKAYIRVGNSEYTKENGSYGLTTLRDDHVDIRGITIRFAFKGKKGVWQEIELKDRRMSRIVKQCRDIPGQELFQYYDENGERHVIDSGDVNTYLQEVAGEDFSAKDFRTWAGTIRAFAELCRMPLASSETDLKRKLNEVAKAVSARLGNTPAVCRKYYIHPVLFEAYRSGQLAEFYEKHKLLLGEHPSEDAFHETILIKFLEGGLGD